MPQDAPHVAAVCLLPYPQNTAAHCPCQCGTVPQSVRQPCPLACGTVRSPEHESTRVKQSLRSSQGGRARGETGPRGAGPRLPTAAPPQHQATAAGAARHAPRCARSARRALTPGPLRGLRGRHHRAGHSPARLIGGALLAPGGRADRLRGKRAAGSAYAVSGRHRAGGWALAPFGRSGPIPVQSESRPRLPATRPEGRAAPRSSHRPHRRATAGARQRLRYCRRVWSGSGRSRAGHAETRAYGGKNAREPLRSTTFREATGMYPPGPRTRGISVSPGVSITA
jgi:hypothetical protein